MNGMACAGHSSCRTPNDALHSFLSAAPFELANSGAPLDAGLQGFIMVVPASSPHSQGDRRYIQGSRLRLLTQSTSYLPSASCFSLIPQRTLTHSLLSAAASLLLYTITRRRCRYCMIPMVFDADHLLLRFQLGVQVHEDSRSSSRR
jgi:hypothetical protein